MNAAEYNIIVDEQADALYRFILKNNKNAEKAKDVVQDAFERLWVNAKNVEFGKAKSYLFSTAYHAMIDTIRREKKQSGNDISTYPEAGHSAQYSDLQEVLHNALQKLPEVQRSVVLLRDYEGYSYTEIAEITKLTEAQVKVYIYRARVFLKKYIVTPQTVV